VGENIPNPVTEGHYNIVTCDAGLQQCEKIPYNRSHQVPIHGLHLSW